MKHLSCIFLPIIAGSLLCSCKTNEQAYRQALMSELADLKKEKMQKESELTEISKKIRDIEHFLYPKNAKNAKAAASQNQRDTNDREGKPVEVKISSSERKNLINGKKEMEDAESIIQSISPNSPPQIKRKTTEVRD